MPRHRTIESWKATKSLDGICIRGIDSANGKQASLYNLVSIELTDCGIIALDRNGNQHRLTT